MYVEELVLYFIILFSCLEISANYDGNVKCKKDARVLVLGGGMAGISTAMALHDAGYRNILILEGASNIGGRIRSAKVGNYTVELGAMWIYGRGSNPVYNMAERYNITMTDSFVDDWTVRDENGRDVTEEAEAAYARVKSAVSNIAGLTRNLSRDLTVSTALRFLNWTSRSEIDEVVESYALDFETGVPPAAHSGQYLHIDDTYKDFGSFDMLAVKNEKGFAALLDHMAETFLQNSKANSIMFNKRVTAIEYNDETVSVKTADGETIEADFAVVTFSLGVLQQRSVKFNPPLPHRKQLAIDMFGISAYTHIYLQFPNAFWDKTMYILYASKFRGKHSFWQNLNSIYPGSNILQLSLFDKDALWVDRNTDRIIIEELLQVLQTLYPNKNISEPTDYAISRWNLDPLTMGAFSYWPTGFTEEDMNNLQAPVGRIHFAGEHLDKIHYGFAHAAYLSGQRAANGIIRSNECHEQCEILDNMDTYADVNKHAALNVMSN